MPDATGESIPTAVRKKERDSVNYFILRAAGCNLKQHPTEVTGHTSLAPPFCLQSRDAGLTMSAMPGPRRSHSSLACSTKPWTKVELVLTAVWMSVTMCTQSWQTSPLAYREGRYRMQLCSYEGSGSWASTLPTHSRSIRAGYSAGLTG
jgi:hypothetical protein